MSLEPSSELGFSPRSAVRSWDSSSVAAYTYKKTWPSRDAHTLSDSSRRIVAPMGLSCSQSRSWRFARCAPPLRYRPARCPKSAMPQYSGAMLGDSHGVWQVVLPCSHARQLRGRADPAAVRVAWWDVPRLAGAAHTCPTLHSAAAAAATAPPKATRRHHGPARNRAPARRLWAGAGYSASAGRARKPRGRQGAARKR